MLQKKVQVRHLLTRIIFFGLIIFLTGCTRAGYHTDKSLGPAPLAKTGTFAWPLPGGLIRLPYGTKEEGVALKGAWLESASTAVVVAADAGKVVFTDERLPGYGKTIILQHANNFSTVYARNSEIGVRVGEEVRRGQPIARAHQENGRAQIYFEIRKKSRAEDPAPHLLSPSL